MYLTRWYKSLVKFLLSITVTLKAKTRTLSVIILQNLPIGKLLEIYFESLRNKLKIFPTFNLRDYKIENLKPIPSIECIFQKNDIGMVIQGPVRHENNFTYFAINQYLVHYPGMHIFLSTWVSEELSRFRHLETKYPNFHIIESVKPENTGIQNVNLQIISTNAGLRAIDELGLKFAIKTRTDQCFFDPYAIDKLRFMHKLHSVGNSLDRIVFLSQNSFLLRLYGPSDMFQFGSTKQLVTYWDVPLDPRKLHLDKEMFESLTMREFCKKTICEVFICTHYLDKLGIKLDFTLKQHFEIFRDFFIIVDSSFIDMIWDKYTYNSERWKQPGSSFLSQEWTYGFWLSLTEPLNNEMIRESLLDVPLGKKF